MAIPAKSNAYNLSRFNARKHGILSKNPLPWESPQEYQALLDGITADYTPQGTTERHLVEELAGIMVCKNRLKQAEQAKLLRLAPQSHRQPELQSTLQEYIEVLNNAEELAGCGLSYEEVMEVLPEGELKTMWQNTVQDGRSGYNANLPHLITFMQIEIGALQGYVEQIEMEIGAALTSVACTEPLARYKTHLSREFNRTLATLLKLQTMRRQPEQMPNESV